MVKFSASVSIDGVQWNTAQNWKPFQAIGFLVRFLATGREPQGVAAEISGEVATEGEVEGLLFPLQLAVENWLILEKRVVAHVHSPGHTIYENGIGHMQVGFCCHTRILPSKAEWHPIELDLALRNKLVVLARRNPDIKRVIDYLKRGEKAYHSDFMLEFALGPFALALEGLYWVKYGRGADTKAVISKLSKYSGLKLTETERTNYVNARNQFGHWKPDAISECMMSAIADARKVAHAALIKFADEQPP